MDPLDNSSLIVIRKPIYFLHSKMTSIVQSKTIAYWKGRLDKAVAYIVELLTQDRNTFRAEVSRITADLHCLFVSFIASYFS